MQRDKRSWLCSRDTHSHTDLMSSYPFLYLCLGVSYRDINRDRGHRVSHTHPVSPPHTRYTACSLSSCQGIGLSVTPLSSKLCLLGWHHSESPTAYVCVVLSDKQIWLSSTLSSPEPFLSLTHPSARFSVTFLLTLCFVCVWFLFISTINQTASLSPFCLLPLHTLIHMYTKHRPFTEYRQSESGEVSDGGEAGGRVDAPWLTAASGQLISALLPVKGQVSIRRVCPGMCVCMHVCATSVWLTKVMD